MSILCKGLGVLERSQGHCRGGRGEWGRIGMRKQGEGVFTASSYDPVGATGRRFCEARFPEKIGIQHPKLVTDGADGSTATITRGSVFRFWVR
jgi:hypothetical protein